MTPPLQFGLFNMVFDVRVDNVIDLTAEGIQGGDRLALLFRQKQETVIKAGATFGGLVLAVLVGSHDMR